jgi:hypothetical protein
MIVKSTNIPDAREEEEIRSPGLPAANSKVITGDRSQIEIAPVFTRARVSSRGRIKKSKFGYEPADGQPLKKERSRPLRNGPRVTYTAHG